MIRKQVTVINDFSGGMNSFDLPNLIGANQGVDVRNVAINRKGRMSKRKGINLFAQDLGDSNWTGIGRFTPDATSDFLIGASGFTIQRATSAASWLEVNISKPLTTGQNTEFIQADKLLFILNGIDFPAWYDGTTFNLGQASDSPTTTTASSEIAKYGAWFKNYLFVTNGAIEKDWVWFSNNLEPLKYTATDVFKVNTGDGQEVLALKPFKLNEMIIYK
ncbi:hypothetical protein LCGC14_2619990, partial [marine sediment metagenome]